MSLLSTPRLTQAAITAFEKENFDTKGVGCDGDIIAEFAGRVCYRSMAPDRRRSVGDDQNAVYLKNVQKMGHGSILEHASYTFYIKDVSRFCTHELVRHRVGTAYSQASTRYVAAGEYGLYIPEDLDESDQTDLYEEGIKALARYQKMYDKLVAKGLSEKVARGKARLWLPSNIGTELVFSANARTLQYIHKLRASPAADEEIRLLAEDLMALLSHTTIMRTRPC